jgi:hypothetical protein
MTTALTLDVIRVPSAFLNGASGVSIVNQVLPAMPGVGPWESTELVLGYASIISKVSVCVCSCCQVQKHLVNKAMVEVENWVEARGVVLAHVAIGASHPIIITLAWDVKPANCKVDVVVRTFERNNWKIIRA